MPKPQLRHRYLGEVRRPEGIVTRELFLSLADARSKLTQRFRDGYSYDPVTRGTTVWLYPVHRDARIEPHARYRVLLNRRGGTTATRLSLED